MADYVYTRGAAPKAGRDGTHEVEIFTPTEWAGSPWSGQHQHGGPVNALFARAAEEAAKQTGLRVVRLTGKDKRARRLQRIVELEHRRRVHAVVEHEQPVAIRAFHPAIAFEREKHPRVAESAIAAVA